MLQYYYYYISVTLQTISNSGLTLVRRTVALAEAPCCHLKVGFLPHRIRLKAFLKSGLKMV